MNPHLLRWLDASILSYLTTRATADGYTVTQDLQYDASAAQAPALVFTDDWKLSSKHSAGVITILLRADTDANIYTLKALMGRFASYLTCIPVKRIGKESVDDGVEIGQLQVRGDIDCKLFGEELEGKYMLAAGQVQALVFGDINGSY